MIPRPPISHPTDTLFPYPTLFRPVEHRDRVGGRRDRHPARRLAHGRPALGDGRSDAMPLDQAVLTARDRETPAPHRLHLAVAHAGQVGAHDIGGGLEHPFLVCESLRVEALAPWPTALGIDRDRRVHAADLY